MKLCIFSIRSRLYAEGDETAEGAEKNLILPGLCEIEKCYIKRVW
jgi:hypothetical protein